jgi:hypothetical protein
VIHADLLTRRLARVLMLVASAVALSVACDGRDQAPVAASRSPAPDADAAAEEETSAAQEDAGGGGGLPIPPARFPRGLVLAAEGVSPGYVLFNPLLSGTAYLIDNEGRVVHAWESPYAGGGGMYLLPNGNLLRPARDPEALRFTAGGTGGILQELDWAGRVVWEWRLSDDDRVHHHDVEPLPSGNLLVLAWELVSAEEAIAAGRRPELTPDEGLWVDYLVEVKPSRPTGGEVVWQWRAWDHLIQDTNPDAPHYGDPAEYPGRLDPTSWLSFRRSVTSIPRQSLKISAATSCMRTRSTTTRVSTRSRFQFLSRVRCGSSTTRRPPRRRGDRGETCSIAGGIRPPIVAVARKTNASSHSTTFAGFPKASEARAT